MEMERDLGEGAVAEITRVWVQELGTEDGATLAARVIDDLGGAETREEIEVVSQDIVATVRALADTYRERGVSDPLVQAWRAACQNEMERVFREVREAQEVEIEAPSIDPDAAGRRTPTESDSLVVALLVEPANTGD